MCDLGKPTGNIQGGIRPVLIISNNKNNQHCPNINVFPLTSKINKRNLPVHVQIEDYKSCGLTKPSTIIVEQPMTISLTQLIGKLGGITNNSVLAGIKTAMAIQFPIMAI